MSSSLLPQSLPQSLTTQEKYRVDIPLACVELFSFGNIAFLAVDVYIAHSTNSFELSVEWLPVVFSIIAPGFLLVAYILQKGLTRLSKPDSVSTRLRIARRIGLAVGAVSLVVGIAGFLWHLNSQFFADATLKNLVYTAPFAAPLAYSGVGLLLLLNRMVPSNTDEWRSWVLLLALGGFVGNFVLSLADHAQNGFFDWREWIPVVAAAAAVGNLITVIFIDRSQKSIQMGIALMLIQMVVGILGWYFHVRAIIAGPMDSTWDKLVYSAPVFAPLLFCNLAILALIGLWSQVRFEHTR